MDKYKIISSDYYGFTEKLGFYTKKGYIVDKYSTCSANGSVYHSAILILPGKFYDIVDSIGDI